ncbi:MAG: DUF559 domain-containing protein [Rhizomicrobium sp.]
MLNVEVDGLSHYARKHLDAKRDKKITSLGWTVLRFSNVEILNWKNCGMPMESYISTTLAAHGIQVSPSTAT